ncbi:protein tab2 like protein [Quercus suber]|uniref:Protein tab2 like protein n=1 Tax=Quercus suber TaxID=58331 RepID=A0AAW0L0C0_QUESU
MGTTQELIKIRTLQRSKCGLIFKELDSDDCVGFWLLLDLPPPPRPKQSKRSMGTTQELIKIRTLQRSKCGLIFKELDSNDCVGFWLLLDLPPPPV